MLCVDAGPELGAVVYARAPEGMVRGAGALGERSGWAVFGGAEGAGGFGVGLTDGRAPPVTPPPAVDWEWGPIRRWRLGPVVRWAHSEHNNVGELRMCVLALERVSRDRGCWGKRCLVLSDSLVAIGVLAKGRSTPFPLLRLARRALAVCAASLLRPALRYVPTWLNCADLPSRGGTYPGVHPDTLQKALQKQQQRGAPLPRTLKLMLRQGVLSKWYLLVRECLNSKSLGYVPPQTIPSSPVG